MRITRAARRRYTQATGETEPYVWHFLPGVPVIIGHSTLKRALHPVVSAPFVQITVLSDPDPNQTPRPATPCFLRQDVSTVNLYWIVATPTKGSSWYHWKARDGTSQNLLVHADDEPDTQAAREQTTLRMQNLELVWRIMYRTGESEQTVTRVARSLDKRPPLIEKAIWFAKNMVAACVSSTEAYRILSDLQRANDTPRLLEALRIVDIAVEPEDALTVLRGALLAINLPK